MTASSNNKNIDPEANWRILLQMVTEEAIQIFSYFLFRMGHHHSGGCNLLDLTKIE